MRIESTDRIWHPEAPPPTFCPLCGRTLERNVWWNEGSTTATEELVCWQGWGPLRRRFQKVWNGPFPQHYRYWLGWIERPTSFSPQDGRPTP